MFFSPCLGRGIPSTLKHTQELLGPIGTSKIARYLTQGKPDDRQRGGVAHSFGGAGANVACGVGQRQWGALGRDGGDCSPPIVGELVSDITDAGQSRMI